VRLASGLLTLAACVLVAVHGWHYRCELALRPVDVALGVDPLQDGATSTLRLGFASAEVRDRYLTVRARYEEAVEGDGDLRRLRLAGWGYIAMFVSTVVLLAFRRLRLAPLPVLVGLVGFGCVALAEMQRTFDPAFLLRFGPTRSTIAAGAAWGLALALAWLAPRRGCSPDARAEVFG